MLMKLCELDKLLRWPLGRSERLAKKRRIPHIILPDGEIRVRWMDIKPLIVSVGVKHDDIKLGDERLVKTLEWEQGAPTSPGVYLFRIPQETDDTGLDLDGRLTTPNAYRWEFRNVYLDENEWLCCRDSNGDERVVRSDTDTMNCYFARVDC